MEFKKLIQSIENKQFSPLYLLHGEEEYYIDEVVKALERNVLTPEEEGFNKTVIYGKEVDFNVLVESARRYPMMAERQLILFKEAQNIRADGFSDLIPYLQSPSDTTVLVVCYKHKNVDARTSFYKAFSKNGVVLKSTRPYENKVPDWINQFLAEKRYSISPKASMILVEFLGNDLSKIANELNKLMLNLPESTQIDASHIEKYIGINKDYNFFELQNALVNGDLPKALKIVNYFGQTQKTHNIVVTLTMLNSFFTKVLMVHFAKPKDRNRKKLSSLLGVSEFFLNDYLKASKTFNGKQVFRNIGLLREFDLKSKGVGVTNTDAGSLLKELIPRLMA